MRLGPGAGAHTAAMERGTRFQRSVVTFGPTGRVVATGLMLLPLWWLVFYAGVFGLAASFMWLIVVLPRALRDIWRPAVLPSTELTRLRDAAVRAAEAQRDAAAKQTDGAAKPDPPRRW